MEKDISELKEKYEKYINRIKTIYYDGLTALLKDALTSFFAANPQIEYVTLVCDPSYYNDQDYSFQLLGADIYDGVIEISNEEDDLAESVFDLFKLFPEEYYSGKFGGDYFRLKVNRNLEFIIDEYNDNEY